MPSPLLLLTLLGLPTLGAASAWGAAMWSWRSAVAEPRQPPGVSPVLGQLAILMLLPATLLIFGVILYITYTTEGLANGPPTSAAVVTLAYGAPALIAGTAISIVYAKGAGAVALRPDLFSRLVVTAVGPEAPAVFGLDLAILMRGLAVEYSSSVVLRSSLAISAMVLGAVESLASVRSMRRTWDFWTGERWALAFVRSSRWSWTSLVGLLLALVILRVG